MSADRLALRRRDRWRKGGVWTGATEALAEDAFVSAGDCDEIAPQS